MKLVELLAKEMHEWPKFTEGGDSVEQDYDNSVIEGHGCGTVELFMLSERASDFPHAHVTRAQWQAERDRQKSGEWKRHRAGRNQPVNAGVRVEVKLRCGDIQQGNAHEFIWLHSECDVAANIMQYKVISQPQAEEVEVIEPISTYKEFEVTGQWHQIDGPLAWRDTIIHCQAIIEDCEREIQRNNQRLADEGFGLIAKINSNLDKIDATLESAVDMSDWRNWKAGDTLECVESNCDNVYTVGKLYKVEEVTKQYARVSDDCGPGSYCNIDNSEDVRFDISR